MTERCRRHPWLPWWKCLIHGLIPDDQYGPGCAPEEGELTERPADSDLPWAAGIRS